MIRILGAGLAGMSAGWHLDEKFIIHERADRVGGHAITDEVHGYRFDRTGHLLHLRDDHMRELVMGLLGEDNVRTVQRNSAVWMNGKYTPYPFQANLGAHDDFDFVWDCVGGYLQAWYLRGSHTDDPETFEDFCYRHFGIGITERFMVPYNQKLWGVHPKEMTAKWCQRFVPIPKFEEVLAGALGKPPTQMGYNANFIYPKQGIGALSEAFGQQFNRGNLRLNNAPQYIDWRHHEMAFAHGRVKYDGLISTIPLPYLVNLLVGAPNDIYDAAAKLRCTSLCYLNVALNVPFMSDLHWVYVPEPEVPFYRVGVYSNFSKDLVPDPALDSSLYVELSDRGTPDMDTLWPEIEEYLLDMDLISHRSNVKFWEVKQMPNAYVVYDHEHEAATTTIREWLLSVGIYTAGRYGQWNYSSMEDALLMGREAARWARERMGRSS